MWSSYNIHKHRHAQVHRVLAHEDIPREMTPTAADLETVTNAFPLNAAVAVQSGIIYSLSWVEQSYKYFKKYTHIYRI